MLNSSSQSSFDVAREGVEVRESVDLCVALYNNRGEDYIKELRKDLSRMIKGSLHNENKSWNVDGARSVVGTLLHLATSPSVTADRGPVFEFLKKLSEKDNKFTKANPDVFGGISKTLDDIAIATTFQRVWNGPQKTA